MGVEFWMNLEVKDIGISAGKETNICKYIIQFSISCPDLIRTLGLRVMTMDIIFFGKM